MINLLSFVLLFASLLLVSAQEGKSNKDINKSSTISEIGKQIIAGAIAGMIEVVCTYPLDVIKTRAMMRSRDDRNIGSTLRSIVHSRGSSVWSIWKGVGAPLLCALPWRAVKLMSFYQLSKVLVNITRSARATILHHFLAGLGVGVIESLILTPFEVVKISIMSDQLRIERMYKSEWDCWAKIYRGEGIVGFLKGYTATCYRQMVFSSVYFVIYQIVKSNLLSYLSGWNLLCFFLSGLLAGTIGSISNNPLDVVKTRIQNDTFMNPVLHNSTTILGPLHVLQKIYRTEGFSALYSGLSAKILRVGPGAAINFFLYEFIMSAL